MISNERRWPSQRQPQRQPQPYFERPVPRSFSAPPREDTIASREVQIERKHFVVALKENPRGRFLRITETVSGKANSIIIPATGLRDFQKLLEEIVNTSNEIPAKSHFSPPTDETMTSDLRS